MSIGRNAGVLKVRNRRYRAVNYRVRSRASPGEPGKTRLIEVRGGRAEPYLSPKLIIWMRHSEFAKVIRKACDNIWLWDRPGMWNSGLRTGTRWERQSAPRKTAPTARSRELAAHIALLDLLPDAVFARDAYRRISFWSRGAQ